MFLGLRRLPFLDPFLQRLEFTLVMPALRRHDDEHPDREKRGQYSDSDVQEIHDFA